jgi:aspartate/tyrosine/aromatic aminotransferase
MGGTGGSILGIKMFAKPKEVEQLWISRRMWKNDIKKSSIY